jgi:hypothetical protein
MYIIFFLFLRPMNGLHNTIELTKIPQGDILFNENRNMVSLQHMYTLGVPNISHKWHQINIVILFKFAHITLSNKSD